MTHCKVAVFSQCRNTQHLACCALFCTVVPSILRNLLYAAWLCKSQALLKCSQDQKLLMSTEMQTTWIPLLFQCNRLLNVEVAGMAESQYSSTVFASVKSFEKKVLSIGSVLFSVNPIHCIPCWRARVALHNKETICLSLYCFWKVHNLWSDKTQEDRDGKEAIAKTVASRKGQAQSWLNHMIKCEASGKAYKPWHCPKILPDRESFPTLLENTTKYNCFRVHWSMKPLPQWGKQMASYCDTCIHHTLTHTIYCYLMIRVQLYHIFRPGRGRGRFQEASQTWSPGFLNVLILILIIVLCKQAKSHAEADVTSNLL